MARSGLSATWQVMPLHDTSLATDMVSRNTNADRYEVKKNKEAFTLKSFEK